MTSLSNCFFGYQIFFSVSGSISLSVPRKDVGCWAYDGVQASSAETFTYFDESKLAVIEKLILYL